MPRNGLREHFAPGLPQRGSAEDRGGTAPGPLAHRLGDLADRWRADGEVLRRRGAVERADLLDGCAVELEAVLTGPGACTTAERPKGQAKIPDQLLTPAQVAERLGTTPGWIYSHWKQLGFGRKISHRALRFSERALERYLARTGTAP
jgi:predicted DNA-binding transcriptional regulator AlpA